ncbi:MAG: PD-(D/E)XK nuclease family protein [Candidatus Bathyarchaeia archaeon]
MLLEQGCLLIDHSSLDLLRKCPRRFYFRHVLDLCPTTHPVAPSVGTAVHATIAAYSRGDPLDRALEKGLAAWPPHQPTEGEWRTPDLFVRWMKAYLPTLPLESILKVDGQPLVEVSFELPLEVKVPEPLQDKFTEVVYIGRIDAIREISGLPMVVDYKTTSRLQGEKQTGKSIPSWFFDRYRLDNQLMGYMVASRHWFEPEPLAACIEAIGWDKYGSFAFAKQSFTYPETVLKEWKVSVETLVQTSLDWLANNKLPNVFNTGACYDFRSACPYLPMCQAGQNFWDDFQGLFVKEPWNPLGRAGEPSED